MSPRVAALAALLAACAAALPNPVAMQPTELAGRVAGTPQRCTLIDRGETLRIADGHTILYGHGRTVWVNRLGPKCADLRRSDILVVEQFGAQYCRGDLVRTLDPVSRLPGPACPLGDFVPYTR
jgi:hypothetical protein